MSDKFKLSGHVDVDAYDGNNYIIIDWKTGRVKRNYFHQIAAYAYLVWHAYGQRDRNIIVYILYTELNEVVRYEFSSVDLEYWEASVLDVLDQAKYVVSKDCLTCSLSHGCTVAKTYKNNILGFVEGSFENDNIHEWSDESKVKFADGLKFMETTAKEARKILKDQVKEKGSLALGDGRVYSIINGKLMLNQE